MVHLVCLSKEELKIVTEQNRAPLVMPIAVTYLCI